MILRRLYFCSCTALCSPHPILDCPKPGWKAVSTSHKHVAFPSPSRLPRGPATGPCQRFISIGEGIYPPGQHVFALDEAAKPCLACQELPTQTGQSPGGKYGARPPGTPCKRAPKCASPTKEGTLEGKSGSINGKPQQSGTITQNKIK